MDILESMYKCLDNWENGGSIECRSLVSGHHSNPHDPDCNAALMTAYHALLSSTLLSWSPEKSLSVDDIVAFVRSVVDHLPSSSAGSERNPNVAAFGEILVDILWAVDSELEEILGDAKGAATAAEQGALSAATVAQAVKAKANAESDKETLVVMVRRFLGIGILDPTVCRERLDLGLVASVGLVADKLAFERKEIRTRTGLFYKQNKFNLLREQSEGYSKLTTELTSSLGPAHSPSNGYPSESIEAIAARARPTWERTLGLIGYFDLDPNRALDIILDVFSVHLATHHSFFLSLLSFSPWGRRTRHNIKQEDMAVEPDPDQYRGKTLSEVLKIAEERAGYRLDDSGNNTTQVLAQVLGFKFTYYQSPDVTETTPQNLYLMAAILIREGFLPLEDLYPHIGPADESMGDLHKAYLASVETRIAGAKVSQLAMAAPLESGGPSNSKVRSAAPEGKKEEMVVEKEAPNQKLGLLNALLSVGALRPAISILSKFPWMVDAYPGLADLMIRVLKHSIVPLFDTIVPQKDKTASFVKPRARFGATGLVPPPERRPQQTLVAPTPPSTSTVEFVFFFPHWAQRIPMCSSDDDLIDVLEPLMRFVGLHVSRDASFLTKLLRVGRRHITNTLDVDPETKKPIGTPDPTHPTMVFWFKVLRMYILPALSLIRGNAVCTVDAWSIMHQFEITRRWQLYGEWKTHTYKSHPELRIRQVQTDRESKGILRRLSHNTIDSLSGAVAKLAYSNPCIFFTNAVNQVMAYDNLAGVVIQALNYVTIMGFDVLVYIILDALANPNKERVKDDGVNISDWLQSLAAFTGMLFRRYSADLTPLLTYVVHQLQNGQTTELVVIRELIWKMAGIEPLPSLSDSQVMAMAGGPTLRIEAVASNTRGARLDPREAKYGALNRLGKALLDSSLALPLLVQVAQQRQSCVFQAPDAHPKSLASLFDTTHGVLLQYLELLTTPTIIAAQDYATKVVPPLAELNEKYGICAPICMQIYRPILNGTLLAAALAMQEKERVASEEAEKRLKAALTAKREPNAAVSRVASPNPGTESAPNSDAVPEPKVVVSESLSADIVMESAEEQGPTPSENPWLPELYPLFEDVKKIAPGAATEIIGPAFYLTFWQLSTYDLSPPAARYDEECATLRVLSRSEDSKFIVADRSADRAKRLTAGIHKDRRNRINAVVTALSQEFKEQAAARAFTIKRLAREKQHWFAHNPKAATLAACIIEYCIQPRCLISPMDADFCAQFIKVMHLQGTLGFPTLMTYDKILGEHVKVVIFSCSEYEARNYGRFLLGVLNDIQKWYLDEQLFVQENRTKSGGTVVLLPGLQLRWTPKQVIAQEDLIKWSDFKQVVRKWHRKLGKCLAESIESGEFMHVYNTIIVLKEILPVFPVASVYEFGGLGLSRAIEKFLEKEDRGDLKILGRAYFASLKKREAIWAAPSKPIAPPAPRTPVPPSQPERSRNGTPAAPAASTTSEPRRPAPISAPSAPKAQLASTGNTASPAPPDRTGTPTSTKLALESVPRPEVVKRVRPETRSTPDGKTVAEARTVPKADLMDVDQPVPQSASRDSLTLHNAPSKGISPIPSSLSDNARSRPSTPSQPAAVRNAAAKPIPSSPRGSFNSLDVKGQRPEAQQTMPPPSEPSQTLSAQELRETAKQSRVDKNDIAVPTEPRSQAPAPSPRRRSPSPTSRPGTRNPSSESRASGDRRSARGDKVDDKRPEREARQEGREPSRRESTRSERRAAREDREKDGERDRERGRDRHGERDRRDRDRDRERDRDEKRERDRERDRDGHRERERERDRDRDRDRHRRDEKDRDRESRKDREPGRGSVAAAAAALANADDRGLPNRPETGGRHRGDESLGKRRRGGDEETDRSSKRSSRKDSHHEDRSRRSSEKDGHERGGRDSERRRRDRDGGDAEGKGLSIDTKLGDKRIPEGPASAKALPPSTPSAPRAMTGGDTSRKEGRDRDWKRDQPPHASSGPSGGANGSSLESSQGGSLRSRISAAPGDRELLRGLPPAPSVASGDRKQDDDRDGGRKRTISDRERDAPEATGNSEPATQAPKRPRLIRDRYATASSGGLAKKLLPIDPQAADKARAARKD